MSVHWLENWLKNKWVHHTLKILFALLIAVLLSPFKLDVLEFTSYDMRMQIAPKPAPSGNVVLLSIDHETLKKLKREPEALDWSVVLRKIGQAGPRQIVTFINPFQIQGSYDDLSLLADIAATLPFAFGENDIPKTGFSKMDALAAPFERVEVEPAPKTADQRLYAKDGVTRRLILTFENQPVLFPTLASQFNGIADPADYKGQFKVLDTNQLMIRFRAKGSYPTIKFIDALEGNVDPSLIKARSS